MRTAKEILRECTYYKMKSNYTDGVLAAMKKYAKEAIEASAERCKGASMMGESEIKQSILQLINELK